MLERAGDYTAQLQYWNSCGMQCSIGDDEVKCMQ